MSDRILGPANVGIDPDLPPCAVECRTLGPGNWDDHLNLSHWIGFAAGCRELLRLVAPDIPQPDCAPGWMRFRAEDGTAGWVLTQSPQPNAWRDWCFRTPAYGSADFIPGADVHVVGASEESNPRRALAMALTAAAEATS
jgi:hypothetical protein